MNMPDVSAGLKGSVSKVQIPKVPKPSWLPEMAAGAGKMGPNKIMKRRYTTSQFAK
jgi:hypothetical protein